MVDRSKSSLPIRGLARTATLTEQAVASPRSGKKPSGFGLVPTSSGSYAASTIGAAVSVFISSSCSVAKIEFRYKFSKL